MEICEWKVWNNFEHKTNPFTLEGKFFHVFDGNHWLEACLPYNNQVVYY